MQDLWLLKMSTAMPRKMLRLAEHSPAWHSLDGELTYVYSPDRFDSSTNPASQNEFWRRLTCLQVLDGASVGRVAPYHYVVETDVMPEVEEELNAWYSQEHLPGLASVAGALGVTQFFWRVKKDTTAPLISAGLLGVLFAIRIAAWAVKKNQKSGARPA